MTPIIDIMAVPYWDCVMITGAMVSFALFVLWFNGEKMTPSMFIVGGAIAFIPQLNSIMIPIAAVVLILFGVVWLDEHVSIPVRRKRER